MVQRHRKAMLDVAPRFRQALAKVAIAAGLDPGIVLRPVVEALAVNFRREQFSDAKELELDRIATAIGGRIDKRKRARKVCSSPRKANR